MVLERAVAAGQRQRVSGGGVLRCALCAVAVRCAAVQAMPFPSHPPSPLPSTLSRPPCSPPCSLRSVDLRQKPEGDGWEGVWVNIPSEVSGLDKGELAAAAARVALAGSYLALEATLTGSLWLAAGTSMAGLVTTIALSRQEGGRT